MNNEFENEPSDEQLDALLRDVQIPANLKSQLLQIPESEQGKGARRSHADIDSPRKGQTNYQTGVRWTSLALAASLIGIAVFVSALYLQPPKKLTGSKTNVSSAYGEIENDTSTDSVLAHSEEFTREIQELETRLKEIEITRLRSELVELESSSNNQLNDRESQAIIMAMAPEYSMMIGGEAANLRSEMVRVVNAFPNTRGADIANQFLDQIN